MSDLFKELFYKWKVRSYRKLILKCTGLRRKLKDKQTSYTTKVEEYTKLYNESQKLEK